jgi:GT2 family glycosyltransferase
MKVSILIPIYNRIEITKDGLDLLHKAISYYYNVAGVDKLRIEIVVIDDGSTDGSSNWIENNYPKIHLLKGDGNLWWAGAINVGANYAINSILSDYIMLWNDDTYCEIDYFIELENILSGFSNDTIIGSTILNADNKQLWSKLFFFNPLTGTSSYNKPLLTLGIKSLNCLTGMGSIIPTNIIKEIEYWNNEKYPQYFGDIDFTLRASKRAFKIISSDKLIIYNKTEYSSYKANNLKSFFKSLNSPNLNSRYNFKIRMQFYKEHCNSYFWIITIFLYYLKYTSKTLFTYIKTFSNV